MSRCISLFLIALLTAFAGLVPSARAIDLPVDGGRGGGPFRIRCDPGSFITGFEGRTGAYIDNFRILCGSFDPVSRRITPRGALPIQIGNSGGGGPSSASCPAGWGIDAIDFQNTWRDEDHRYTGFVHHINFNCTSTSGSESIGRTYGPTTPVPTQDGLIPYRLVELRDQQCPRGQLAVGFQGRSGLYVDALGLICEPIPGAAAPPQVVTPLPIPQGKISVGQATSSRTILPQSPGGASPPPPPPPAVAAAPPAKAVNHSGFTGVWDTHTDKNWTYTITFTPDGKSVSGKYVAQNGDKGKISGKVRDNVLEFKLEQDGGYKGTGQFALAADGNSFSGSYRIDPNKKITDPSYLQGTWSGTRR